MDDKTSKFLDAAKTLALLMLDIDTPNEVPSEVGETRTMEFLEAYSQMMGLPPLAEQLFARDAAYKPLFQP